MAEISQQYCIAASHPCFSGHFPGNPIVPGVVILDYARLLLQQWQPTVRIKTITQAKFMLPLRPEQPFTVQLIQTTPTTIKFECTYNAQRMVAGAFVIECCA